MKLPVEVKGAGRWCVVADDDGRVHVVEVLGGLYDSEIEAMKAGVALARDLGRGARAVEVRARVAQLHAVEDSFALQTRLRKLGASV